MKESAYIHCLWVKTGKYRHRKFSAVSFRQVVSPAHSKLLSRSSLFHFSALRCRHSHPRSQLWMTGKGELKERGRGMLFVILKIHHQLTGGHESTEPLVQPYEQKWCGHAWESKSVGGGGGWVQFSDAHFQMYMCISAVHRCLLSLSTTTCVSVHVLFFVSEMMQKKQKTRIWQGTYKT